MGDRVGYIILNIHYTFVKNNSSRNFWGGILNNKEGRKGQLRKVESREPFFWLKVEVGMAYVRDGKEPAWGEVRANSWMSEQESQHPPGGPHVIIR